MAWPINRSTRTGGRFGPTLQAGADSGRGERNHSGYRRDRWNRQTVCDSSREPDTLSFLPRATLHGEALSEACPGTHSWISVDMSSDGSVASFAHALAAQAYRAGRGGSDAATTACDERMPSEQ